MALTTSAGHSDVALGAGRGRHPRGGTSLGKSVLACECGCVLVSWAYGTVPT